jgi:hypothetical protein
LVLPAALSFGYQPTSTTSAAQLITVYNTGTTNFSVNSVTVNAPFNLVSGVFPITLRPGQHSDYGVTFTPTKSAYLNGTARFTFVGAGPITINLNGTGADTKAMPSVQVSSLTFSNQPLGTTAPPQNVNITNIGTDTVKLTGVTPTYPFSQTGFSTPTAIGPNKTFTVQIGYFPTLLGTQYGTVQLTFDVAAPKELSLTGTGSTATALGVAAFPTLPSASTSSAYQATLAAVGASGSVTWSLASGSSLPSGLTLSSSGLISGTLASSVATGNYTFTVQATDSHSTASSALTLPVYLTTGANCNNISWNVAGSTTPLAPISDLGTGYYLGEQGGLYAAGSNTRPSDDDSYGVGLARAIGPLDSNGNPSPTGKYVLVGIGLSATQQPFDEFVALAGEDPSLNSNLVIVNGATGGATAKLLSDPTNAYWTAISNNYLPNAGVTKNQVVAAWISDVDGGPTGTFPSDTTNLQSELESIAQNLLIVFPNIKLAYYSSLNYTGYSNGVANLDPEPYAYEAGFAVKNAIQDQLNGDPALNYNPALGPVTAPWMSWGAYYWTNGMLPRSDGLVWTCQDAKSDGTHPSNPVGRIKVSTQLLNFFKTDDTTTPWFLAPLADKAEGRLQK